LEDTYNWLDPANPIMGNRPIRIPASPAEALALISHINPKDRQALADAFDEGFRIGGMKTGLQFIQDTAARWRADKDYVPFEE
jgi:hypothetical protein